MFRPKIGFSNLIIALVFAISLFSQTVTRAVWCRLGEVDVLGNGEAHIAAIWRQIALQHEVLELDEIGVDGVASLHLPLVGVELPRQCTSERNIDHA